MMAKNADVLRGPFDPGGQPDAGSPNPLQLGIFAWNLTGGTTASKAILSDPERYQYFWHWERSRELIQTADRIGMEFELPFGRWLGHGGPTHFNDDSIDFVSSAAALAPITRNCLLMSTAHVTYGFHPMHFAKFGASMDYISGGRWGLNVVTGWFPDEQAMFGKLFPDRDKRYEITDEFVTLMKWVWASEERINYEGEFYQSYGAHVSPKPVRKPRPILVNAGQSPAGIDFAAKHCDWAFCNSSPAGTIEQLRTYATQILERAAYYGRRLRPMTFAYVIMADTDAEAERIADWVAAEVDEEATDTFIQRSTGEMGWSGAPGRKGKGSVREQVGNDAYLRMALGLGGYHAFGSPQTVAETFRVLQRDCAMEGVLICFLDPQKGLHQVEDDLIPILKTMGLRK